MTKFYQTLTVIFILILGDSAISQTVGTIQYDPGTYEGYSMVHPLDYDTTYLIDNCGKVINQWSAEYANSTFAEITSTGTLIRSSIDPNPVSFSAGGSAGIIQELDWDGTVLWEYFISDSVKRSHHDLELMPNGNILVTAWELKTEAESEAAGRIPGTMLLNEMWMTVIYELEPVYPSGANIVWEWHAWDHLVQDVDNQLDNFGNVQTSFRRLDINKGDPSNAPDWAHVNALHYNEELDHIIMSAPTFNEIWMIDHGTTTSEATDTIGGNRGVGGDLLWRWGNPISYNQGTISDQVIFFQHDCQWVEEGVRFKGFISVFDNQNTVNGQPRSKVKIIAAEFDTISNSYPMNAGKFLPISPIYNYDLADTLYSARVSGVQVLPNDNLLITSGSGGRVIEIDSNETVLWHYSMPIGFTGNILTQNDVVAQKKSFFKMKRYLPDYIGLAGQDLTPGVQIEMNPIACDNSIGLEEEQILDFLVYPNPASNTFSISNIIPNQDVLILDALGREILNVRNENEHLLIDCSDWSRGVYYLRVANTVAKLLVQ